MNVNDLLREIMGSNFYLDEVLVVGPYPTAEFIKEILNHNFQKRTPTTGPELTILIDDGWNQKYIEQIQDEIPSGHGVRQPRPVIGRIAAVDPRGLVHAKIYFFRLGNFDKTYTKRYLLVGSANASKSGFGVHAETFINIDFADLDLHNRELVENYLQALKRRELSIAGLKFSFGNKSWINLPPLKTVTANESGFDAWLRRGIICHKYQSDPSFGRLNIRLLKSLPKTTIETAINEGGLGVERDKTGVSSRYVEFNDDDTENDSALWRSKYFIETDYGYWVSGECFSSLGKNFCAPNSEERKKGLNAIKVASITTQKMWATNFIVKITNVYTSLLKTDPKNEFAIDEYFEIKNGDIDVLSYTRKAELKLEDDRGRAKDDGFADRFTSGYAFHRLPDLGDDFEEFARCFCESLLIKMAGRSVKNKLVVEVRKSLGHSIPDTPTALLYILRSEWASLRSVLVDYHVGAG